ncbi:MAG: type II secretion system F family protein [Candidatus Berkiellales bacterium]
MFLKRRIPPRDISVLIRQLSTLLGAGIPLLQSCEIIVNSAENKTVKHLMRAIQNGIETGLTFASVLQQFPKIFSSLYCQLVAAGEISGTLDIMLQRIATYHEKNQLIKQKVKKALFYPATILIVTMIAMAILLIFAIPQFEQLFNSLGAELPTMTRCVLQFAKMIQQCWVWILFLILSLTSTLRYFAKRNLKVQWHLDHFRLKLPIVGEILIKLSLARFARTTATLYAAGIPLLEALETVKGVMGNMVYSKAVQHLRQEITKGTMMHTAMRLTGIFPSQLVQMVAIGEESGSLDKMLSYVADLYEEETDIAIDNLNRLLEPLLMSCIGVVIGALVIAMYLPIFQIGSIF